MQIEMKMTDLLYVNYAVDIERLRRLVPAALELDLGYEGKGIISAVAFKVAETHSSTRLLPSLSFDQVNYRTYVDGGEGPAVYFFGMQVNSRVVVAGMSFIALPIDYEGIEIQGLEASETGAAQSGLVRVATDENEGINAEAMVGESGADFEIPPDFITERPIGYVSASAGGLLRISVDHPLMPAVPARVVRARAPFFTSLGLLDRESAAQPHSALYVPQIVMKTGMPAVWLPPESQRSRSERGG